jgi:hypothetical protein
MRTSTTVSSIDFGTLGMTRSTWTSSEAWAKEQPTDKSRNTRLILTSDDDFLTDFGPSDYNGLLFIDDETLSPTEIADIVHAISEAVDQSEINRPFYVSRNWL